MLSEKNRFRQFAQVGTLGSLLLLAACDDGQVAKDTKPMPPVASAVEPKVVADTPPAPPPVEPTPVLPKEPFDIHFTIGSAQLSPDAMEALTSAVDYLRDTPAAHVTLMGYTDPLGSAAVNMKLAEQRVASTAEYMEEHGVDPSRIEMEAVGEADSSLVPAGEDSATWNRRVHVEFEVASSS